MAGCTVAVAHEQEGVSEGKLAAAPTWLEFQAAGSQAGHQLRCHLQQAELELQEQRRRLNDIYVKHTGQTITKVEEGLERDNFMNAEAAVEWGLIDKVLEKRAEEPQK